MTKERKIFDFIGKRKLFCIISACIILVGLILNIFLGTELDINFKGGTIFTYSYSKDTLTDEEKTTIENVAKEVLQNDVKVNYTTDFTGQTNQFKISMADLPQTVITYSYTASDDTMSVDAVKEAVKQTFEKDYEVTIDAEKTQIKIVPTEGDKVTEAKITSLTEKLTSVFPNNNVTFVSSNSVTDLESQLSDKLLSELGTKIVYSYTAESVDSAEITKVVDKAMGQSFNVDVNAEAKTVTLTPKDSGEEVPVTEQLTVETTKALNEKFADAGFALASERYDAVTCLNSNSVKTTVGRGFFIKCIFAVILAALFITLYVGIRFRKIGGVSAGVFAMLAIVHDIVISYLVYVIFRIPLDANFIAVVLTILGYSLNATIIIYDRIRENERIYGRTRTLDEIVNMSVSATVTRNIFTTVTTFLAVATICIVSYLKGVTSIISFALPMAVGLVAGCYSSVLLSSPLWAKWRNYKVKRDAEKAAQKKLEARSKKSKKK